MRLLLFYLLLTFYYLTSFAQQTSFYPYKNYYFTVGDANEDYAIGLMQGYDDQDGMFAVILINADGTYQYMTLGEYSEVTDIKIHPSLPIVAVSSLHKNENKVGELTFYDVKNNALIGKIQGNYEQLQFLDNDSSITALQKSYGFTNRIDRINWKTQKNTGTFYFKDIKKYFISSIPNQLVYLKNGFLSTLDTLNVLDVAKSSTQTIPLQLVSFTTGGKTKYLKDGKIPIWKNNNWSSKTIKNIIPISNPTSLIPRLENSYYIEDINNKFQRYFLSDFSLGNASDYILTQAGSKQLLLFEDKIYYAIGQNNVKEIQSPFYLNLSKNSNVSILSTKIVEKGTWIFTGSGIQFAEFPQRNFIPKKAPPHIDFPKGFKEINKDITWVNKAGTVQKYDFVDTEVKNELPLIKSYQLANNGNKQGSFSKDGLHFTINKKDNIIYAYFNYAGANSIDYLSGINAFNLSSDSIVNTFDDFNAIIDNLIFNRFHYDEKSESIYLCYHSSFGSPSNNYKIDVVKKGSFEKVEEWPEKFTSILSHNRVLNQYEKLNIKGFSPISANKKLGDLNLDWFDGVPYLYIEHKNILLFPFNNKNGNSELFVYDTSLALDNPTFLRSYAIGDKITQIDFHNNQVIIGLKKGEIQFIDLEKLINKSRIKEKQFGENMLSVYINKSHEGKIKGLNFINNGQQLLIRDNNSSFSIWDLKNGLQTFFETSSDKGWFYQKEDTLVHRGKHKVNEKWLLSKEVKIYDSSDYNSIEYLQYDENNTLFLDRNQLVIVSENDSNAISINKLKSNYIYKEYEYSNAVKKTSELLAAKKYKNKIAFLFSNGWVGVYSLKIDQCFYKVDLSTLEKINQLPKESTISMNYGALTIDKNNDALYVSNQNNEVVQLQFSTGDFINKITPFKNSDSPISAIEVNKNLLAIGNTNSKVKIFSTAPLADLFTLYTPTNDIFKKKEVSPFNQSAFYVSYLSRNELMYVDFSNEFFTQHKMKTGQYKLVETAGDYTYETTKAYYLSSQICLNNKIIGIDYSENQYVMEYDLINKSYKKLFKIEVQEDEKMYALFKSPDDTMYGIYITKKDGSYYEQEVVKVLLYSTKNHEKISEINTSTFGVSNLFNHIHFINNHELVFIKDGNTFFTYNLTTKTGKLLNNTEVKNISSNYFLSDGTVLHTAYKSTTSTKNKLLYSIDFNKELEVIDLTTSKSIKHWPLPIDTYRSFLMNDDKVLVTASEKKEILFWDVDQNVGELLATMYLSPSMDYIIYTPDLYYTSTKSIDDLISIKSNNNVYKFEQFDLMLNRPDIVFDRLKFANPKLVEYYTELRKKRIDLLATSVVDAIQNIPTIKVKNAPNLVVNEKETTLSITAASDSSTLASLQIWVNNVPFYGSSALSISDKVFNINQKIPLSMGENKIEVSCTDTLGRESIRWARTVNNQYKRKPKTIIVSIGVSQHQQKDMNLKYADKDAKDFAQLFIDTTDSTTIETILLQNEMVSSENVKATKTRLMETSVDDQVYIFYAGHGTVANKQLFLSTYEIDFNAPEQKGLSYNVLENLLDSIPARNKALFIDACQSGELLDVKNDMGTGIASTESPANSRGLKVKVSAKKSDATLSNIKAVFNELRRGTGAFIFSSASGMEYAYEGEQWKNGVFTYALLKGLSEEDADQNNDGIIKVSELQDYLFKEVSELTNGRQNPTNRLENIGNDFNFYNRKIQE
ncbi:caspase family protein [Flammeovirga kamogawensis]|uniref:Caspase family protein n=1 Tax=Flammeovirga kamogawensis TaxID=373891 RepID=A0ABX8H102_9BACT|nr:caspase family protein [Flammeovirga kamogawensis]MBB6462311.1 hypothetical protein [Flammeovirga kamogawensis]QWG09299.1 caspase family protein [Flammeovirga kamogawensis]TRX64821.1 caspase family protein [Flammeovirga kamogawensis]